MKITIEPTEEHTNSALYSTVSISNPSDDLTADLALALAKSALVAWGYSADNLGDTGD